MFLTLSEQRRRPGRVAQEVSPAMVLPCACATTTGHLIGNQQKATERNTSWWSNMQYGAWLFWGQRTAICTIFSRERRGDDSAGNPGEGFHSASQFCCYASPPPTVICARHAERTGALSAGAQSPLDFFEQVRRKPIEALFIRTRVKQPCRCRYTAEQ